MALPVHDNMWILYKNRIPVDKVQVALDIPRMNPLGLEYKRWWKIQKRRCIDGYWVQHNGDYKWVSGPLYWFVNFWKIKLNPKGAKTKIKKTQTPFLRDLEWIKAALTSEVKGFSGFEMDDEISCHNILNEVDPNKDPDEFEDLLMEYNNPDLIRDAVTKPDGTFKTYVPAREYLRRYFKKPMGKAMYYNMNFNMADMEARGGGKSYFAAATLGHNFIFDGALDYDEYLESKAADEPMTSETLVGAIDSKYSNDLIGKIKLGFNNLPGKMVIGDDVYPSPFFKKYSGSWDTGKDLRWDTKIFTVDGVKEIKDISIGDKIYDDSGILTKVCNKFSFTDKLQYKVTLQDGRVVYCGADHQWEVIKAGKNKVMSLIDIYKSKYVNIRGSRTDYMYRLPLTKSLEYSPKQFTLEPYFLGLWLGDGSSRGPSISTVDTEIVEYLKQLCLYKNLTLRAEIIEGKCPHYFVVGDGSIRGNSIRTGLQTLNLIQNKHIPEEYFYGSYEQRKDLLQGLLDSDGSIGIDGTIEFSNKNKTLIKGVELLCHSLGIRVNLRKRTTSWKYKGIKKYSKSYRLFINTEEIVFKLSRKKSRILPTRSSMSKTSRTSVAIVNIEPTIIEDSYCLSVDNESKLFLCGDYVVTHNTITAGYDIKIGGQWERKGSASLIQHRSFNDNHVAANGTRPNWATIDEVGFMVNLIEVLGQMKEAAADGTVKQGTIWMCGTGGDMTGGATEAVKQVFYSPAAFDCLQFDDEFEGYQTKIGFFVPAWMTLNQFKDELGNTNWRAALKYLHKTRERLKKNVKKKQAYEDEIVQRPLVHSEVFLLTNNSILPTTDLKEHKDQLLAMGNDPSITGLDGWMLLDEDYKPYFNVDPDNYKPASYPVKITDDNTGAVVIWERPDERAEYGWYVAGNDPYDFDIAPNSVSLGSVIIIKRATPLNGGFDRIVAEYTGRPGLASDFYEQVRRMLRWYGDASCLYENEKQHIKEYFKKMYSIDLLAYTPGVLKANETSKTARTRVYGQHMPTQVKNECEIYLREWLLTPIGDGKLQLHTIKSIPLLDELISYNVDGNFDRVIALMLAIIQLIQMRNIIIDAGRPEEEEDEDVDATPRKDFFSRKLFTSNMKR